MNYHLVLKFGETVVPIEITNLKELTITQDIDTFLPEFKLVLMDNSGTLTHLWPSDNNTCRVYLEFAQNDVTEDRNAITFIGYRIKPLSDQSSPSATYSIEGLLETSKLFSPTYTRGFSGTVKSTIETIATEFGIDQIAVSSTLAFEKNLVQTRQTNREFLKDLKRRLLGSAEEYGYKCFVAVNKYRSMFVFRSISEMLTDTVSYKFALTTEAYQDRKPIYSYRMFNNGKLLSMNGGKQQTYSYFDYETGVYKTASEYIENYTSLSSYYAIDSSDLTDNNEIVDTGRSNDFTTDFKGYVKGRYGNRLLHLVNLWITTEGTPNIVPGQTVEVFFPQGTVGDDLCAYQYSGYWIVSRVVQMFGDEWLTKLLLVRHGLDTSRRTSLLPATFKKR